MARFSPIDAVFAGFRFVRERPATLLVWAAYLLVVVGLAWVAMRDIGGEALTSLVIAVQGSNPDPNQLAKLAQQAAPASLFADLLITIFGAVLVTAILRVRLTPGTHPWGGLKLGGDELRMLGATLLVLVVVFGLSMMIGTVADLLGLVGAPPFVPIVLGLLLILAVQVRLSLVGVISQSEGRISLPRSIQLTKGLFWRLVGAYVVLAAITLVILFLLLVIFATLLEAAAMATGGGVSQAALALQGRFAEVNPLLAALAILSNLAQVWVIVVFLAVILSIAVDAYAAAIREQR
jgi:hypothetical protein